MHFYQVFLSLCIMKDGCEGFRAVSHFFSRFSPWSVAAAQRRLPRGSHLPVRILRHETLLGANQTGWVPDRSAARSPRRDSCRGGAHFCPCSCSQIIHRITFVNPPAITPEWKRKVAQDAIESLSAAKLAKSICSQFRTRLNSSHEAFAASLRQVKSPRPWLLENLENSDAPTCRFHHVFISRVKRDSSPPTSRLSFPSLLTFS